MESLERLQGLHADLIAFSQKSLTNIDRLWHELEDSIQDFRRLLDRSDVPTTVAAAYKAGRIEVAGQEYGINDEFRHLSNAIATALNIEEENAGRLIIETQAAGISDDEQAIVADVVQKYHDRRDYLLQDIRLVLHYSSPTSEDDEHEYPQYQELFRKVAEDIVNAKNGAVGGTSDFANKCVQAMTDIEAWQIRLNEQIQSKAILSQARGQAFYLTLEFQRSSLFKQHEALGAILASLFNINWAGKDVLYKLHEKAQKWQRLDFTCIHYLPAFSAAFQQHGSPDGSAKPNEAQTLNATIISKPSTSDEHKSSYRPLLATLEMWWTAVYSGFFRENAAKDPNAEKRDEVVRRALDDGSLEFMLSICMHMKNEPWQPTSRLELVDMLLGGSNTSFDGVEPTSPYFFKLMMEAYETFAESWIYNMPDSIRKLKSDEDDQRLLQITAPNGVLQRPPRESGARMHLEAFLATIAFSFEGRPEAATQFWEDPDGNLHGFLQWASRRQTVPRVAAFCEMLCAISEGFENAGEAHKFLLEDTIPVPNSRRKLPSLSYQQIFAELDVYSRRVHQKPQSSTLAKTRQSSKDPELNESESPVMLSLYLRLLKHLFTHTSLAREFVLSLPELDLLKSLLILSSGPIPSYLRAAIFSAFEALLTDKTPMVSDRVWATVEEWASTNHDRALAASSTQQVPPTNAALQNTLAAISTSYDQSNAFVRLLTALIDPLPAASGQPLPFPPDLGVSYRYPGIVPYVDFACAQLSAKNITNWLDDGNTHGLVRCIDCVTFMIVGLTGFNEKFVSKLDKPSPEPGSDSDYARMYSQRHPFARVMQWVFTVDLTKCLMDLLHQPFDVILSAPPGDPKVIMLERVVELLNFVIDLQPTYFDIVKPKLKRVDGARHVQASGITAIEDSIIGRPELVLDLCQYAATEHVPLALQSLQFLQKLSASAKFQNHLSGEMQIERKPRQMIEMIGPLGESRIKHVSMILAKHFGVDFRELEAGDSSDGYQLKAGVLAFLDSCLAAQSEVPNLAHLLLGFERISTRLTFTSELEQGTSMLDSLIALSSAYPEGEDGMLLSWLIEMKSATLSVLHHLWSLSISSDLTMTQMRRTRFLVAQMSSQSIVSQSTVWDGHSVMEPVFWFRTSAEAYAALLRFRSAFYDYVTREVRHVAKANIKALQEQYVSALQGRSIDIDGTPVNHPSVFDLFDFAELDTTAPAELGVYQSQFFQSIDIEAYKKEGLYDIEGVRTVLLHYSRQQIQHEAELGRLLDEDELNQEIAHIISLLEARNRCLVVQEDKLKTLRSYVDMVISIVDCCPMDAATRTSFSLRMLQLILPKLDTYFSDGTVEAVELTRAADILLLSLASAPVSASQTRVDITVAEKLFQLFRSCAEGIALSTDRPELRTILYSICSQYLTRILSSDAAETETSHKARSNAMDTVRSAGARLISIVSDDADDGLDSCRLNALSFLGQLVSLARSQNSNFIVEQFVKSNIIEVLLEPIKDVGAEFQATDPNSKSFCERLSLVDRLTKCFQVAPFSSKFTWPAPYYSFKSVGQKPVQALFLMQTSYKPFAIACSSPQTQTSESISPMSLHHSLSSDPSPHSVIPSFQLAKYLKLKAHYTHTSSC